MRKIIIIVSVIVIGIIIGISGTLNSKENCTTGWYITGYYTPNESDFDGELIEIQVEGSHVFSKQDFIDTVKIEGWGKMTSGEYLGWYDSTFHISSTALDMYGNELRSTMVAADPVVLEQGTKITIPSLPKPWNEIEFTVTDIGPSIVGKHVDVYIGEGDGARVETERITGEDNKLCIK